MGRAYLIDAVEYPSVTTILDCLDKPALKQWAVNMALKSVVMHSGVQYDPATKKQVYVVTDEGLEYAKTSWKEVSQKARDIGSEIHHLIKVYVKDGQDAVGDMRPEVENGFLAFLDWEKKNVEEWIRSEMKVYNKDYGFAGTLDAVAKLKDGRIYIIDFKSSKGFYDGYDLQVAAYRCAFETMPGTEDINVSGMGVLRLDKETGMPEWKEYGDYMRKKSAFLSLLEFWYKVKKRRLKGNTLYKA